MSAPAWLATLGLVAATGQTGDYPRAPADVGGAFDHPPVVQWIVRLPGPPPQSATHTEMGGPLLHGDRIYVGNASDDALLVLDRRTGGLLERLPTGAPVQATPVVVDEHLFFSDAAGTTFCYDLANDGKLWSHFGGAPILSSPMVHDGVVYVSDVANVVVALAADTGDLKWRHAQKLDPSRSFELELYGAPAPVLAGDLVLTGFSDGTLTALEASTGEVAWQRRVGEGQYPDVIGEAAVRGGDVIVAGYTEPLLALDMQSHAVRWRLDVGGAQAATVGAAHPGDAADSVVFHGGGDGILRCIDGVKGDLLWQWDSKTSSSLTRPLLTEAGGLVGASGGSVYLVDAATGKLRWAWRPGYNVAGVTAAPDVDGRQAVVLTNAGNLVSFVVPRQEPEWAHEHGTFARVRGK